MYLGCTEVLYQCSKDENREKNGGCVRSNTCWKAGQSLQCQKSLWLCHVGITSGTVMPGQTTCSSFFTACTVMRQVDRVLSGHLTQTWCKVLGLAVYLCA